MYVFLSKWNIYGVSKEIEKCKTAKKGNKESNWEKLCVGRDFSEQTKEQLNYISNPKNFLFIDKYFNLCYTSQFIVRVSKTFFGWCWI